MTNLESKRDNWEMWLRDAGFNNTTVKITPLNNTSETPLQLSASVIGFAYNDTDVPTVGYIKEVYKDVDTKRFRTRDVKDNAHAIVINVTEGKKAAEELANKIAVENNISPGLSFMTPYVLRNEEGQFILRGENSLNWLTQHEAGHAVMAYLLGAQVARITTPDIGLGKTSYSLTQPAHSILIDLAGYHAQIRLYDNLSQKTLEDQLKFAEQSSTEDYMNARGLVKSLPNDLSHYEQVTKEIVDRFLKLIKEVSSLLEHNSDVDGIQFMKYIHTSTLAKSCKIEFTQDKEMQRRITGC